MNQSDHVVAASNSHAIVPVKEINPVALARLVAEVEGPMALPGRYNRTHNRHNR